MNILKVLKENNINYSLKYLGSDDMATSFEIKSFVENGDLILNKLNNISNDISDIDDYINYCYICHILEFNNSINNVVLSYKDKVTNFINTIQKIFNKYDIKNVIKYVLNNYKVIFEYKDEELLIKYDLQEYTANFIFKHLRKNRKIFEYLCKEYSFIIIDNFDSIKNIFFDEKNFDLVELLFSEKNIKKNILYRQDEIQKIIKRIKDSPKMLPVYKVIFNKYVSVTKELFFNSNEDNVIRIYNQLKNTLDFIASIKEIEAEIYKKEFNRVESLLNKHLEKHGFSQSIELDLSPWFDLIDNENIDITLRLLTLTERRKENKYFSLFQDVCSSGSDSIMDLFSSTINTDDTFKNSTLLGLNISMMYLKHTINHIIRCDTKRIQYVEHIGGCFKNYLDRNKVDYDENDITADINMLMNGINIVLDSYSEHNEYKSKFSTFSLISFVSGLMEKYCRCMYKTIVKDKIYIDESSLKLKNILDDKEFQNHLNKDNTDCIEYFLLKRNKVGLNIRNIIDHYDDDLYKLLNYDNVLLILSMLLIIANIMLTVE